MPERLVRDLLSNPSWRQFLFLYRIDDSEADPDNVELRAPEEESDYLEARPGDHLFCPFECDFCSFMHLKGRLLVDNNKMDNMLLIYI